MKVNSIVDVITNSSSSIYTVLNGIDSSEPMHRFLMKASKFFGSDVTDDDIKVDVVKDSNFTRNAVEILKNNPDYTDLVPEGMTPIEFIISDPWEVFYQLAYYEDIGEPYSMTIKNVKTGQMLEIYNLYQVFTGVESGQG